MMQLVFENIVSITLAFVEIIICYNILCKLIPVEKPINKKAVIIIILAIIFQSAILMENRKIVFSSYNMMFFTVIITSLTFWNVSRKGIRLIATITITYYLFIMLSELFFAFLSMVILDKDFIKVVYQDAVSWWQSLIYFGACVCAFVIYSIVKKKIANNVDIVPFQNILLILDVFLYVVLRKNQQKLEAMAFGEQEMLGTSAAVSLVIIASVVGFIGIIWMKNQIIKEENKNFLVRDEIYKRNYDEMESMLKTNRQLVHDMKNHFLVMKEMIEENDLNNLYTYIDDICEEVGKVHPIVWSGNHVLDIILNQKKTRAEQKGIQFTIDSVLLPVLSLTDIEICSLFGNLLDNAIEANEKASDKKRYISIKIDMQQGVLFIKIVNSISEKPIIKKGRLTTSKQDKEVHGYGLKSVERICTKHDGIISYKVKDDCFEIIITLFNL